MSAPEVRGWCLTLTDYQSRLCGRAPAGRLFGGKWPLCHQHHDELLKLAIDEAVELTAWGPTGMHRFGSWVMVRDDLLDGLRASGSEHQQHVAELKATINDLTQTVDKLRSDLLQLAEVDGDDAPITWGQA